MNTLRIDFTPEGEAQTIEFNKLGALEVGPDGEVSDRKIRPLVLLALYTEYTRRSINRVIPDKDNCPSLKRFDIMASKILSEAMDNKKNYTSKNDRDQEHWIVKIFGRCPVGKWVSASRATGDVGLMKNVEVDFHPKIEGKQYLGNFCREYLKGTRRIFKTLKIDIHAECQDTYRKEIISSESCYGYIRTHQKLYLDINSNFKNQLSVFWISPDRGETLHPSKQRAGISESAEEPDFSTTLKIAHNWQMFLGQPSGTEVCIVIDGERVLEEQDCASIVNILTSTIPRSYRDKTIQKPEFTRHILKNFNKHKKEAVNRGLIFVGTNRDWRKAVAEKLGEYGKFIYIFCIPHL